MPRLGKEQTRLLGMCASPSSLLMTTDRVSASLVRRGLLAETENGSCHITPAGLRALADEIEAGRIAAPTHHAKGKTDE